MRKVVVERTVEIWYKMPEDARLVHAQPIGLGVWKEVWEVPDGSVIIMLQSADVVKEFKIDCDCYISRRGVKKVLSRAE